MQKKIIKTLAKILYMWTSLLVNNHFASTAALLFLLLMQIIAGF